jgi:Flp pilus assembly protein TadD/4-amino-4-deoxy-L-arabinose transferase-like glycosyltransferase
MQPGQKTAKSDLAEKNTAWEWFILAGILLLGLLMRVSYLGTLVHEPDFAFPRGDMQFHDYWARGLVTGNWTPPTDIPAPQIPKIPFLRPPAYPYFLALIYWAFGTNYLVPRIVQMGLGLISAALAFLLGRSLFGRITGLLFAAFMSTYWAFIYFEGELHYPALLIVLILALINVLRLWTEKFTYTRAACAGVLLGICVLTSPNMILLLPVIAAWGWWVARRRKEQKHYLSMGLVFVVATVLSIAPATIRNCMAADNCVLISCNGALPLYCANNENSDLVSPIFPGSEKLIGVSAWGWMTYPLLVQGVQREQGRPMKYSEVSSYFTGKALKYIREHPRRVLGLVVTKALLFWGPLEVTDNKVIYYDRENSAVLRYSPGFSVFLTLCIVGGGIVFFDLRAARKSIDILRARAVRQTEICVLIFLFVATYFISFLPLMASARYRVPIIPFILLFGAYAISRVGQFIRDGNWRIIAFCVCAGAALYLEASKPLSAYQPSLAEWHFGRGLAYQQNGKLDEAVTEYQEALRLKPDFYIALANLASALSKQGKYDEALVPAQTMVQLNPNSAVANLLLGCQLIEAGHADDGINHLIKAVNLEPNNFYAHLSLATALAKEHKFDQAMVHLKQARQLQPDNPAVHKLLAKTLAAQDKREEAKEALRESLRLKPDDNEAKQLLDALMKGQNIQD